MIVMMSEQIIREVVRSTHVDTCPECGAPAERYPREDLEGITRFKCSNGHKVGVDSKTNRVLSVSFPFIQLESCPQCGAKILTPASDQTFYEGNNLVQLVYYRCPQGHLTPKRQMIQRRS